MKLVNKEIVYVSIRIDVVIFERTEAADEVEVKAFGKAGLKKMKVYEWELNVFLTR